VRNVQFRPDCASGTGCSRVQIEASWDCIVGLIPVLSDIRSQADSGLEYRDRWDVQRMPQHVSANLLFAHTLGYFVLAPEVCFQDQPASLSRRPKLSRHSRQARTPMYLLICRVVVMQEVHPRTEVRQTTEAVVGKRAVCILLSAAGRCFQSARLVPPARVVEASVVGIASAANWSAIANIATRTTKHSQRTKLWQTSEVSWLASRSNNQGALGV
jgi:hypothetical protein